MFTALQRRQASRALRALLSVIALAALLQSSLFAMVDGSLLGWRPDHGHVYSAGIPTAHTHPSDGNERGAAAIAHAHVDPPTHEGTGGVVFTSGDLGAAASAGGALAVPASLDLALDAAPASRLDAPSLAPPGEVYARVPAPPPRV